MNVNRLLSQKQLYINLTCEKLESFKKKSPAAMRKQLSQNNGSENAFIDKVAKQFIEEGSEIEKIEMVLILLMTESYFKGFSSWSTGSFDQSKHHKYCQRDEEEIQIIDDVLQKEKDWQNKGKWAEKLIS